ncbi:hypothetical protein [Clostridium estertheticum]|uniref:Uncharacterized protein n=1 Tax=Clostridium estertheticum TaxID=238834 RepID=A0A7Y3SW16_9CLOT|nr:hypothetical protein [Clostridium estertheticum]NNU76359.1 hypothetical protein [Clostridium estertheticum]WBL45850.1 hypothetical protein LOR37_14300 [Clostridium estertheticum]
MEEESSEPKSNESKKVIYPHLETLLSVIQKEYEYESDRAKNFENRTGFLLSFAGALLVFLLTNSKFPNTIVQKLNTFRAIIPYSILIITIALTFLTIIASVFCFIRVVSIGKYNRINVNNVTPMFAKGEKEAIKMGLLLL